MTTKYEKGAYFERRVRDWLRAKGYIVWRTPGSKSPCDLIANAGGEWSLWQCQTNPYFEPKKVAALAMLCFEVECVGYLAWRDNKQKIQFKEVG